MAVRVRTRFRERFFAARFSYLGKEDYPRRAQPGSWVRFEGPRRRRNDFRVMFFVFMMSCGVKGVYSLPLPWGGEGEGPTPIGWASTGQKGAVCLYGQNVRAPIPLRRGGGRWVDFGCPGTNG